MLPAEKASLAFFAALGRPVQPEISGLFSALCARAEHAFPELPPDPQRLGARLAAAVDERLPLREQLAQLAVEDLALAQACLLRSPAALERLEALLGEVAEDVRRVVGDVDLCEEILQRMRVKLLVPSSSPPKLEEYDGRGPLLAWLRTVALRQALSELRALHRLPAEGEALAQELVDLAMDPELQAIALDQRDAFKTAFAEALLYLSARERLLLKLRYVKGLELEDVARFAGVHRSTVVRALAQLREDLVAGIRLRLKDKLRLSSGSLDSLMRALRGTVELSLERLLRRFGPAPSSR